MLRFPDGTKIRVIGLDDIMADLYSQGRQANQKTAEEIIHRLEAQKNFIPFSEHTRKEYAYVLLKEYRQYIADRKDKTP